MSFILKVLNTSTLQIVASVILWTGEATCRRVEPRAAIMIVSSLSGCNFLADVGRLMDLEVPDLSFQGSLLTLL